ncbi:MAG: hypothetical protein ACHP65_02345 [Legionellales bacterium]
MAMKTIQKGAADFSFILGTGLMYAGAGALFIMAVVGTLAVDLVLLSYAAKQHNAFLTGFLWGSLFCRPNSTLDPTTLFIASPIMTGIAIALAFGLGVPGVGIALIAGWAVAATLFGAGYLLRGLADVIKPDAIEPDSSERCGLGCFA